VTESKEVALYYCEKRAVPKENIVELDLPKGEDITRKEFDERLCVPLRAAIKDKKEKAKVLISTYGVPLRVGRPELKAEAHEEVGKISPQITQLQAEERCLQ